MSFSPSCETNALPFIFVLFYPAASSVWLFIALSSSLCLVSSLLLVWYSSCSSSHPCEPALLLFPPFSSSVRWSFGFQYSHLFLLGCFSSHTELSFPHLPFKLFASLPSAQERYRALGESYRKKEQTCSRVQSEISKISFQLWEMVITVDKSLGIKFLLMASRCTR